MSTSMFGQIRDEVVMNELMDLASGPAIVTHAVRPVADQSKKRNDYHRVHPRILFIFHSIAPNRVYQTSIQAGMFPARGEGAAVSCDDLDCRPHRFTDLQPSHRRVLTPGLRPAGPLKATPSRVRQRVLNSNRAQDASPVKSSLISPPAEPARARSAMAGGAGIGVAGSPGASALISDQPGRGAK